MPRGVNLNVLVGEDEKDIAQIYVEILTLRGHKVKLTFDGEECVNRYKQDLYNPRKRDYDIVILDHNMPRKNGSEVAKEILQENPNQRIIFVSAFGKDLIHELEGVASKIDFLTKPLQLQPLVDLVENKKVDLKEMLERKRESRKGMEVQVWN